ncbi:hypothetical protein Tco_1541226 [Tanacetum coccineum]
MKPKCSTCGSTDHLTKEHPEQAVVKKTLAKLKAQSSQGSSSRKAPMIPKPYIDCKYCGFNGHHSDGCDICGSISHEIADCTKKPSYNNRKPMISNRYSKESVPKVVFRDNSSGDTEGYGSVNCNGITFTRVAYVNGLKHNLISINQLCDANFKVLFTKTQEPYSTKTMKLYLLLQEEEMYMSLICHLTIKKAMHVSLPKPPVVSTGFGTRDYPISISKT